MILSKIVDGTGNKNQVKVTKNHELCITAGVGLPYFGVDQKIIPLRQYLTTDGTSTGTNSMLVDGSTTNVEYYIGSNSNDRYITQISFMISDTGPTINKFGNIAALTNGCQFYYTEIQTGIQYFHEALKSNFDFIRMCLFNPSFGTSTDAFMLTNVVGASEAYVPTLDLLKILPPYGLQIKANSVQKLVLKIRDNLTGIDGFDCIVYGFERLP